ncbi:MAG: sugar ABC transporter permease, partial [Acholeplasmatales bacterium]|nr:sugar ABC transporter permease [Acholeplasmatales bacterium]
WIGVPYTMLLTTGILMNIPKDLYEAASIDGASKVQVFTKITLPYVFFITTPALITTFMGNITSFNIIYLLTGGAGGVPPTDPSAAGGTDLLVTWLYKLTVDQRNYNVGAVISILTFVILSIGTLITYQRSKSYKEEEAFQ